MPYQMKNGKWRATKMIDGQRKTAIFATKSEAKKWEANQCQEAWAKQESPTHSICWLEFLNAYLQNARERFCKKTFDAKRLAAKISLEVIAPNCEPEKISPREALAIIRLARTTHAANKLRKHLSTAWIWGKKYCGLPAHNPFLDCAKFPADSMPREVPTQEEFWAAYEVASVDEQALLLFLLHTGARAGEAFRLVWDDIDFENCRLRLGTRKTSDGSMRYDWLPMTEALAASLAQHRQRHPFGRVVFGNARTGEEVKGRRRLMRRLCAKAGVKAFGFHGIRHLSATTLAYAGLDLPTIQAMLRHTSPATTARYIKELGIDRNKIESAFSGMKKGAEITLFAPPKKAICA